MYSLSSFTSSPIVIENSICSFHFLLHLTLIIIFNIIIIIIIIHYYYYYYHSLLLAVVVVLLVLFSFLHSLLSSHQYFPHWFCLQAWLASQLFLDLLKMSRILLRTLRFWFSSHVLNSWDAVLSLDWAKKMTGWSRGHNTSWRQVFIYQSSLPLLPGQLWIRLVVLVSVPSVGQIELFNHLLSIIIS